MGGIRRGGLPTLGRSPPVVPLPVGAEWGLPAALPFPEPPHARPPIRHNGSLRSPAPARAGGAPSYGVPTCTKVMGLNVRSSKLAWIFMFAFQAVLELTQRPIHTPPTSSVTGLPACAQVLPLSEV